MASHSWCPVNSLQPIPIPRKNHTPIPACLLQLLPIPPPPLSRITTEFCTFPNRISSNFTAETASSSYSTSTSSPSCITILAAPDEGQPPPDPPRLHQKEALSPSLFAILHRLFPYRGASHPSSLSEKLPLTEHNNPSPTARPLGLLCARCAPIIPVSVPRTPRLTAVSRQFRNLIDRQSLAPQEIRQFTPSTTTNHLPNSIPLSSCCRTHPQRVATWPLASANTAARTRHPRPGRRSTLPPFPTFPTSDRRASPTDGVSASTSAPVFFPRRACRLQCGSPSPWQVIPPLLPQIRHQYNSISSEKRSSIASSTRAPANSNSNSSNSCTTSCHSSNNNTNSSHSSHIARTATNGTRATASCSLPTGPQATSTLKTFSTQPKDTWAPT